LLTFEALTGGVAMDKFDEEFSGFGFQMAAGFENGLCAGLVKLFNGDLVRTGNCLAEKLKELLVLRVGCVAGEMKRRGGVTTRTCGGV
jgi:hypothetical protein